MKNYTYPLWPHQKATLHYRERINSVKGEALGTAFAIMIALMSAVACSAPDGDEVDRRVAESFLRNSPTFRFDGLPDSVDLLGAAAGDCTTCREFTFGFESSHPGYGDRSTMTLDGAVTQHKAVITIEDGLVTAARIDNVWDVLTQRPAAQAAAATPGTYRPVSVVLDSPFELLVGQEAVVSSEDLTITFVDVPEDSRCPASTNCDASGRARVRVDVTAGGRQLGLHELVLRQRTIGGTVQSVGQYVLSMRELNPYPGSGDTRYAAIFVVSKVIAA